MIKYQAILSVLLISLLAYSAKSQSDSQGIFRHVDIGNNYKIGLDDNINSHKKYLNKIDDNCFQLVEGTFENTDEIFIYTDKNDKIRKFKFTYSGGTFFETKVKSYKAMLGLPTKEIQRSRSNLEKAIWEDAKTRFTILSGRVVYAELVNKENVHHPYAEYINDNSISTRISLKLAEDFKDNNRDVLVPKLVFRTIEVYSSMSYQLKFTEFITDDEFIIRFEEVKKPDFGLAAIGPATSVVNLPENIDKLVLINGETVDIYRVEIADKFISLSPVENSFTGILHSKIPKRTKNRLTCRCVPAISDSPICEDFFNVLRNNPSFTEHKNEKKNKASYSIGMPRRNRYLKSFDYKNKADFDLAIELLSDFVRKHNTNGKASISLGNWNGQSFADYDVVK